MKKFLNSADEYLQSSSWKDLALIKLCLFSVGLLAGMEVAERRKGSVRIAAAFLFTLTYIPLMSKYLGILLKKR